MDQGGIGGVGGRELLAFARERRPDLPVLLITGFAGDAAPTPDAPVLRKPFDRNALAAALDALESRSENAPP